MTEKEYRSHPAVSRSELWSLRTSPEKYIYFKEHPSEPTPALIFGQVFHAAVLQPDVFDEEFAIMPQIDRRTKEGKAAYAEFLESTKDKTVISEDELTLINAMKEKLMNTNYVKKLLSGEHEKEFFWADELTGEECKCRADAVIEINGVMYVIDLKTAASADTETFMKHAIEYGYHVQAAMYSEGVKIVTGKETKFVFIAIEKAEPYAVNIMIADDLFIKYGYDVFRELIGIYHECKESGNWYGYLGKFNEINSLGLPPWLVKEMQ